MGEKKKIVVGMSGASGAPIAVELLRRLSCMNQVETHVIITHGAELTLKQECGISLKEIRNIADYMYDNNQVGEKLASGSFQTDGMIVVPCSMKTVAGIVCGYSDNLLLRACDVTIKEHRKLILVARESPLSSIHLQNLYNLSRMGTLIVPPMMSYYSHAECIEAWTAQFVQRLLGYFQLDTEAFHWNGMQE